MNCKPLEATGERLVTQITNETMIEHLHRYALAMELAKEKRVLDIASGEGYGSNLLSVVAESVVGVDISEEAIKHAKAKYVRKNLLYMNGSASSIPLESNQFDLVVSFETIEHHEKHNEMIQEIKRVLKPNGVLIISSPDKLNYSDIPGYANPYHPKELYLEEFRSLVSKKFINTSVFYQRVEYASVIAPEENVKEFHEFWGSYSDIYSSNVLRNPVYDIIIASDFSFSFSSVSLFNGNSYIDEIIKKATVELGQTKNELVQTRSEFEQTKIKLDHIKNGWSYRLGRALLMPALLLKNVLRNKK